MRSEMADEPEILSPQEAAEFLRVPLLTVQRQAKAGRLPGRRIGAGEDEADGKGAGEAE